MSAFNLAHKRKSSVDPNESKWLQSAPNDQRWLKRECGVVNLRGLKLLLCVCMCLFVFVCIWDQMPNFGASHDSFQFVTKCKKSKATPCHPYILLLNCLHKYDTALYLIMMQFVAFSPCQYIDKRICTLSSRHKFYPGNISTTAMTDIFSTVGALSRYIQKHLRQSVTVCGSLWH